MSVNKIALIFAAILWSNLSFGQQDEFYHDLYDSMHDSPMQQKFKKNAPMPFGA